MGHNIGTGIVVGAVITIGMLIYNSKYFNSAQKKIILLLLIFPPVGILSIIIISLIKEFKKSIKNSEITTECNISKTINDTYDQSRVEIQPNTSTDEALPLKNRKIELITQINLLLNAKQDGLLTEEEYSIKVNPLLNEKSILEKQLIEIDIKNTIIEQNKEKFDNLEKLKVAGLISEEDFEEKTWHLLTTLSKQRLHQIELQRNTNKHFIIALYISAILIAIFLMAYIKK